MQSMRLRAYAEENKGQQGQGRVLQRDGEVRSGGERDPGRGERFIGRREIRARSREAAQRGNLLSKFSVDTVRVQRDREGFHVQGGADVAGSPGDGAALALHVPDLHVGATAVSGLSRGPTEGQAVSARVEPTAAGGQRVADELRNRIRVRDLELIPERVQNPRSSPENVAGARRDLAKIRRAREVDGTCVRTENVRTHFRRR